MVKPTLAKTAVIGIVVSIKWRVYVDLEHGPQCHVHGYGNSYRIYVMVIKSSSQVLSTLTVHICDFGWYIIALIRLARSPE